MKVLVTGHRGYIGSVMVTMLKDLGCFVIGVDNAPRNRIDFNLNHSIFANCSDDIVIDYVLEHGITHIFHFAASSSVGESVTNPGLYYSNNVGETAKLLNKLNIAGWQGKFIFSSTAAVYGQRGSYATEHQEKYPLNPYGQSKLMCEKVIEDVCYAAGINAVIFRYFNVAGAYGEAGDHVDAGHIIPKLCAAAFDKKKFTLNGDNFHTSDGTCIRDYVHVVDICRAHLEAAEFMEKRKGVFTFNLGSSHGFSNKEIIDAFIKHTGQDIEWDVGPKRKGDPDHLAADNGLFKRMTGFEYKHTDLEKIITSSWEHYQKARMRNDVP